MNFNPNLSNEEVDDLVEKLFNRKLCAFVLIAIDHPDHGMSVIHSPGGDIPFAAKLALEAAAKMHGFAVEEEIKSWLPDQ